MLSVYLLPALQSAAAPAVGLMLPWAAIIAGGGALYGLGVLRGRFDKHEKNIERRVEILEQSSMERITRVELDARFQAFHHEVSATKQVAEQVLLLVKQFLRKDNAA
jgi:hypothetical protein